MSFDVFRKKFKSFMFDFLQAIFVFIGVAFSSTCGIYLYYYLLEVGSL